MILLFFLTKDAFLSLIAALSAQVAQSVEQRTENPRVDSSILSLGTMTSMVIQKAPFRGFLFCGRINMPQG